MHKRTFVCAALVATLLSLTVGRASAADYWSVRVDNLTTKDVFITVYSLEGDKWRVVKGDCVHGVAGGKTFHWSMISSDATNGVKIQAEAKSNGCRSDTIYVAADERKGVGPLPRLDAEVYFQDNRYLVKFK